MKFNELANSILNEANLDGGDLGPESGPGDAFKHLESALDAFYALGQKGLGADAAAVNDRVYNMLQQREVDQADIKRFADALTSIILGQSIRGYAVSQG